MYLYLGPDWKPLGIPKKHKMCILDIHQAPPQKKMPSTEYPNAVAHCMLLSQAAKGSQDLFLATCPMLGSAPCVHKSMLNGVQQPKMHIKRPPPPTEKSTVCMPCVADTNQPSACLRHILRVSRMGRLLRAVAESTHVAMVLEGGEGGGGGQCVVVHVTQKGYPFWCYGDIFGSLCGWGYGMAAFQLGIWT